METPCFAPFVRTNLAAHKKGRGTCCLRVPWRCTEQGEESWSQACIRAGQASAGQAVALHLRLRFFMRRSEGPIAEDIRTHTCGLASLLQPGPIWARFAKGVGSWRVKWLARGQYVPSSARRLRVRHPSPAIRARLSGPRTPRLGVTAARLTDRVPRLSERCLLARPCGARVDEEHPGAKHGRAQTTGLAVAPFNLHPFNLHPINLHPRSACSMPRQKSAHLSGRRITSMIVGL